MPFAYCKPFLERLSPNDQHQLRESYQQYHGAYARFMRAARNHEAFQKGPATWIEDPGLRQGWNVTYLVVRPCFCLQRESTGNHGLGRDTAAHKGFVQAGRYAWVPRLTGCGTAGVRACSRAGQQPREPHSRQGRRGDGDEEHGEPHQGTGVQSGPSRPHTARLLR